MISKIAKFINAHKRNNKPVVFFDLPSSEKKRVIKKAIHLSNNDQKELVKSVKGQSLCSACRQH